MPAVEYAQRLPGWKRSGCCDSFLLVSASVRWGSRLVISPNPLVCVITSRRVTGRDGLTV